LKERPEVGNQELNAKMECLVLDNGQLEISGLDNKYGLLGVKINSHQSADFDIREDLRARCIKVLESLWRGLKR